MGVSSILKKVDAFPKIIDIEVNKTFSGAFCKYFIPKQKYPRKNFRAPTSVVKIFLMVLKNKRYD